MQLKFVSLLVDDQEKAIEFYTSVLGFKKITDVPAGEYRWITVAPPDGIEGVELVLEPSAFPPAKTYQSALLDAGIPAALFVTKDIDAEFKLLRSRNVKFSGEPIKAENLKLVVFEDTCGNLIQLIQLLEQ
jgi:catechol 2,3-dioxygenase-like lactoylglutathione lyase family enzyme